MFVGHYAVSFWFKARDPSLPLWVLVIAVQLVDIVWAGLVLLGVERVAIVPGITAASPLDLQYVPYTHSLTAVGGWSLLAMWLWFRLDRNGPGRTRRAVLVGSAVFSHWLGDLLVHRPDLPIYDNRHKVGLGLWDYAAASFMLETGLLALTMWFWYRSSQRQANRRNLVLLFLFMVATQAYTTFGPNPSSAAHFVLLALGFYLIYALASRSCDVAPSTSVRIPA